LRNIQGLSINGEEEIPLSLIEVDELGSHLPLTIIYPFAHLMQTFFFVVDHVMQLMSTDLHSPLNGM